nr:hypothetical protein [Tanacetum cinerariifolium]
IKTVNDDARLQALIDGKKVVITEASIWHDLMLNDAEGTSCLSNVVIFEELARMGYEKPSEKLTFYKAFFSPQWMFFIHTILQSVEEVGDLPSAVQDIHIPDAPLSSRHQRKHKPRRKERKETEVLDLENEVIEMKSSHKAKIAELKSRVEKLEEENRGGKLQILMLM